MNTVAALLDTINRHGDRYSQELQALTGYENTSEVLDALRARGLIQTITIHGCPGLVRWRITEEGLSYLRAKASAHKAAALYS